MRNQERDRTAFSLGTSGNLTSPGQAFSIKTSCWQLSSLSSSDSFERHRMSK